MPEFAASRCLIFKTQMSLSISLFFSSFMSAVLTSFNTAFLPISRSHFKQREISMLISLTTVRQFCVNFTGIFWNFLERDIFSQRIGYIEGNMKC